MKKIIMCLVIVSLAMLTGCSGSKSEDFYYQRAQMHFDNLEAHLNKINQDRDTTVKVPHKKEEFRNLEFEKKEDCCYISGIFLTEYIPNTKYGIKRKDYNKFIIRVKDDGSAKFTSIKEVINNYSWLDLWISAGFDNYLPAEQ